jgi:hypothetical protein
MLPFAVGLAVVIAAGLVYGAWTQRWRKSPDLEAAAARLRNLPDAVGRWKGEPVEVDPQELALAGAEGAWVRRFTHERTGATVQVALVCGRPGPISVHRPENCYRGAGFDLAAPPTPYTLRPTPDAPPAAFWTGRFTRPEAGGESLRVFWSWYADGAWRAPDNPRWEFARQPALYKLYVVRETGGRGDRLDDDPAVEFMRQLVPELSRVLSGP